MEEAAEGQGVGVETSSRAGPEAGATPMVVATLGVAATTNRVVGAAVGEILGGETGAAVGGTLGVGKGEEGGVEVGDQSKGKSL